MFAITWMFSPAFAETRSAYASTCTGRLAAPEPEGAPSPRVRAHPGSPARAFSAAIGFTYPAGRSCGYVPPGPVITGSPVPLFVQASNAHAATARHQFRMAGSWALAHPPATPPDGGAVWEGQEARRLIGGDGACMPAVGRSYATYMFYTTCIRSLISV